MIKDSGTIKRNARLKKYSADLVVTGGGLSGVCCAVTAARQGMKVVLVQDRPVLGGNSSSEVRLWVLGATSHMGNNNRWAREGGVIDELLLENSFRNPEGNPLIFDTILLEKVVKQPNITLLLNTCVYDLDKSDTDTIKNVKAFCSQNSTGYELQAPLFCDASGDGIVGFLSGAAFRMGAESTQEFGEKFAPTAEYGELLGHSLYFYSKDIGKPVRFVPPAFALDDITRIPRFKSFNATDFGCRLWWIEYGGRLDTVHETETIKWELWKVVYGVWNYIKNSGKFPEAETMTLEWVGTIPGKRESRRFEGDYMLRQQDVVNQVFFEDAVAFGGWSIDLHPADGIFSEKPGCNQWHSKGIYSIPYRCYYSSNIKNLFIAGRIISASHVAFGSSRVMATSAHGAQAVGMAAALCKKYNVLPKTIGELHIKALQQELLKANQHIPGHILHDEDDLVQQASVRASSTLVLDEIPAADIWKPLMQSSAQMLPVEAGTMSTLTLNVEAEQETTLVIELRRSGKSFNHTPDVTMESRSFLLTAGINTLVVDFTASFDEPCYAFICFLKNESVKLQFSDRRITGILSVFNSINPAVSNYGRQQPTGDLGVDAFEFWCPQRRPEGQNIAMKIHPALRPFPAENLMNGLQRPVASANAWVAEFTDDLPLLTFSWDTPQQIKRIHFGFDADYDNPLETVLIRHPETVMPCCVEKLEVLNCNNQVVATMENNHLNQHAIYLEEPLFTKDLKLRLHQNRTGSPVSVFEVRCYSND